MNNLTNTATPNTNDLKPMSNFEDWIYQNVSDSTTMPYSEKMNVSQSDSTLLDRGYVMDNNGHHNVGNQANAITHSSNDNINQFTNFHSMNQFTNYNHNNTNHHTNNSHGFTHPNGMNKSLSLDGTSKNYTFNTIDDTRNLSTLSNTNGLGLNVSDINTQNTPFNIHDLDYQTVQKNMQARNASLLTGHDGLYKIEENSGVESCAGGDAFANYQTYSKLTSDGMIDEHDMRYNFLNTPVSTVMSATASNMSNTAIPTQNAPTSYTSSSNTTISPTPESTLKKTKKAKNKGKKPRNKKLVPGSSGENKEQMISEKNASSEGLHNDTKKEQNLANADHNASGLNNNKSGNTQDVMVKLEKPDSDQSSVLQLPDPHDIMGIKLESGNPGNLDLLLEEMPAEVLGIDVGMGASAADAAATAATTASNDYLKTEQDNDADAISKNKPASKKGKNKKKIMTAQQKEVHNRVEKKYRININTKIARLQKAIPWLASANASTAFEIHESEQMGNCSNGAPSSSSSSSSLSSSGSSVSAESLETLVPEENDIHTDSLKSKTDQTKKNDNDERKDSVTSLDNQPKLNKSIILEKAVDYIMYLQNNEKLYGLEVQRLKAEIKRLKKMNPNSNSKNNNNSNSSNFESPSNQSDCSSRSTHKEETSSACVSPTNTSLSQSVKTSHQA